MKSNKEESVLVFEFKCIKPLRPAAWKSKAVAVIHEYFNKTRTIYIPIWEKRDLICAMADCAKVYRHRNNPYVDVEWYINYYDTIGRSDIARMLRINRMEWERYLDKRYFII